MNYFRRAFHRFRFSVGGPLLCVLALLLGFGLHVNGDGTIGFSLIVHNGGTPQGAAVTLNCDGSTINCATSKGVVTISASGGGLLQSATVTLAQSDLLTINATPFTLVPAQGAGTVVFPVAFRWKLNYVANPYQSCDGAPVAAWWQNSSNIFNYIIWGYGAMSPEFNFLGQTQTVATYGVVSGLYTGAAAPPAAYTNQPLVLQLQGPAPAEELNCGPLVSAVKNASGTGYAAGDQLADFNDVGTGVITVNTIGAGGSVGTFTITTAGTVNQGGTGIPWSNVGNVTSATPTTLFHGTGYMNGDTGTITGCGDGFAAYTVLTSTAGLVNTVSVSGGSTYATMSGCTTTVSTGGGDGTLDLDVVAGSGSGFTTNNTVTAGDGSLTVTTWFTVGAE